MFGLSDYGLGVHPAQPPLYPGSERGPSTIERKPAALIVIVIITAIVRVPPLVFAAFLALFGLASSGPNVAEFERVDLRDVYILAAIVVVGVILVACEIYMAAKVNMTGLTVASGAIALADAGFLFWIFAFGDSSATGFITVIAITLVVQIALTIWAAAESSQSSSPDAVGESHVA